MLSVSFIIFVALISRSNNLRKNKITIKFFCMKLCPNCNVELYYLGLNRFHEGRRWGVIGNLGELFVKKKSFNIYTCPKCGKVEFYIPR